MRTQQPDLPATGAGGGPASRSFLLSSSASSRCVNLRRWSHFSPRPPVEPFQPRARPRHAPAAELAWAAGPAPERDGAHDLRLVHAACRVDPFERAVHRLARTRPTATASATGALQGVSAAGARARGEQEPHLEHPVHLHLRNLRRPPPLSAPLRPAPRACGAHLDPVVELREQLLQLVRLQLACAMGVASAARYAERGDVFRCTVRARGHA